MPINSHSKPDEQPMVMPVLPVGAPTHPQQPDVAEFIRGFNAQSPHHEELWTRILHAVDAVRYARDDERAAAGKAQSARLGHLAIQAEDPDRRAPRSRQLALAAVTLALDAVACDFAAQALGNGQLETLAWTALFLAVLAGGELALDFYRERRGVWRVIATGLGAFVTGLGVLRYSYLITVGAGDPLAALVGAALFTAATSLFVMAGYWILRRAETPAAGRARRRARRAAREAAAASDEVARRVRQRDKLVDAYVVRLKASLLQGVPASQLPLIESALRSVLLGGEAA